MKTKKIIALSIALLFFCCLLFGCNKVTNKPFKHKLTIIKNSSIEVKNIKEPVYPEEFIENILYPCIEFEIEITAINPKTPINVSLNNFTFYFTEECYLKKNVYAQ